MTDKINIYNNAAFIRMMDSAKKFEMSKLGLYYKTLLCLKNTTDKV